MPCSIIVDNSETYGDRRRELENETNLAGDTRMPMAEYPIGKTRGLKAVSFDLPI